MLHRVESLTHSEKKNDPERLLAICRCGFRVHVHADTRVGRAVEVSEADRGDEPSNKPCSGCALAVGDYVVVTDLEGDFYRGRILEINDTGCRTDIGSRDFWAPSRIRLLQRP